MTTYRNMNNIPGPGDPETWGPCTNHPLDPRTPDAQFDEDVIEEKRLEMANARLKDSTDWLREAFSEADEQKLLQMWVAAFSADDPKLVGHLATQLMADYVLPSEEEAAEALVEEAYDEG